MPWKILSCGQHNLNATYVQPETMGRLGVKPSNVQRIYCILIACIIYIWHGIRTALKAFQISLEKRNTYD